MITQVNTIRSDYHGFNALAQIALTTSQIELDTVVFDFSSCAFFEANMTAPLHVIVARNYDRLNDVEIVNVQESILLILRKNHFLERFGYSNACDCNQTTLPFKIFKLSAAEQFVEYLEKYMQGRGIPQMSPVLSKKFRQSLLEIFQNAALHSESESGIFVCGQFYPQKQRIDFTIADAGIGIRQNVRRYLRDKSISSCEAIQWAMAEGNTTKTGCHPGGLGLKLIKDFIVLNNGKLQIVSRHGFYQFSAHGENVTKMKNDFPGTCMNIEIKTSDTCQYCLKSELQAKDIF